MLMREKYDEVAKEIMEWEDKPSFWKLTLFTCTDVEGMKPREDDEGLWRYYKQEKAEIQNKYNLAVKNASKHMQGQKVPSGKGIEHWFIELFIVHLQMNETAECICFPGESASTEILR